MKYVLVLVLLLTSMLSAQPWAQSKIGALSCWMDISSTGNKRTIVCEATDTYAVPIGQLPPHAFVYDVAMYIDTAFNGSAKDSLTIGISDDLDWLCTYEAVSSTGAKDTDFNGTTLGYEYGAEYGSGKFLWLYYPKDTAFGTTGEVFVSVLYVISPTGKP